MRTLGIVGLIIGAAFALVALNMDVSVSTGFGRVNNMGLMADRQNYLIVSIGMAVISVLLIIFGKRSPSTDDSDTRACPFCAERIKIEAIKCKHCGSAVPQITQEDAIIESLGSFFAKPEGMSIGEYHEQFLDHYKVSQLGSGYLWDGDEFTSFNELTQAIKARTA